MGALLVRWAMGDFDRLAKSTGKPARLVGGGAGSNLWCQIFADVLGRTLERVETPALAGARGSAMVAAVAAGWYKDLTAASVMARTERTLHPEASMAAYYAERFEKFSAAYRLRLTVIRGIRVGSGCQSCDGTKGIGERFWRDLRCRCAYRTHANQVTWIGLVLVLANCAGYVHIDRASGSVWALSCHSPSMGSGAVARLTGHRASMMATSTRSSTAIRKSPSISLSPG
jgi:hypothetical protein